MRNSSSFVEEAKTWDISSNEMQVSYDVINLYPSIPINEAVDAMISILANDIDDLKTRTKLTLVDIHQLVNLCVSINYFLYENEFRVIENSGPIGLALMVVISEAFLQYLEQKPINQALLLKTQPITFRRYVDDSHSRFENIEQSKSFLQILNAQNPCIQYTVEKENEKKEINFLDITIINNLEGKYDFKVFRKDAITNIQIKPT